MVSEGRLLLAREAMELVAREGWEPNPQGFHTRLYQAHRAVQGAGIDPRPGPGPGRWNDCSCTRRVPCRPFALLLLLAAWREICLQDIPL